MVHRVHGVLRFHGLGFHVVDLATVVVLVVDSLLDKEKEVESLWKSHRALRLTEIFHYSKILINRVFLLAKS